MARDADLALIYLFTCPKDILFRIKLTEEGVDIISFQ
jgi:hypothetical protein